MRRGVLGLCALAAALALAGSGAGGTSTTPVATAISDTYFFHSCALVNGGRAACWGFGLAGDLGNGSEFDRQSPVSVADLPAGLKEIATGDLHSCALTGAGAVYCWGSNRDGELGDGVSGTSYGIPVLVSGLSRGVQGISAGATHTCALMTGGGVKCWGNDIQGQLGAPAPDGCVHGACATKPIWASGLRSGVAAIAAGGAHTCALLTSGRVDCWGDNEYGQLGDGTTTDRFTPTAVAGLADVAMVSGGGVDTCAVTKGGAAECWGSNQAGQVGDGTTENRLRPVAVSGLGSGVRNISVSGNDVDLSHACAVLATGRIDCWGSNIQSQLGDGTQVDRHTPTQVNSVGGGASAVAAGWGRTCAIVNGHIECWGSNYNGWLGVGPTYRSRPAEAANLSWGMASVSSGQAHTCAVTAAGGVECWGRDLPPVPATVTGFDGKVVAVASGARHSCALTEQGEVECWGENDSGALGDGTTTSRMTPAPVSGLGSGVTAIAAGRNDACAINRFGGMECWGTGALGGLANDQCSNDLGSYSCSLTPTQVTGLATGVAAITAAGSHTCALLRTGGLKCWGTNQFGEVGDGTHTTRPTPVDVKGLKSGVADVSAGAAHTCAVLTTGHVKCWGQNDAGELGNGSRADEATPTDVLGLSGIASVSAGGSGDFPYVSHTCALTTSGGVTCWGGNAYGQLGTGNRASSFTPVDVRGLTGSVRSISSGESHTCAVTERAAVECWGRNDDNQLGDGEGSIVLRPHLVQFIPLVERNLRLRADAAGQISTDWAPKNLACRVQCSSMFDDGLWVRVIATPDPGARVQNWSGACRGVSGDYGGTGAQYCDVQMTQTLVVGVHFDQACKVPSIRRKRLAKARTAIEAANCAVGKIRRAHSRKVRKGRVLAQRPRAGSTLPPDGKVSLTLSRGQRRHR